MLKAFSCFVLTSLRSLEAMAAFFIAVTSAAYTFVEEPLVDPSFRLVAGPCCSLPHGSSVPCLTEGGARA